MLYDVVQMRSTLRWRVRVSADWVGLWMIPTTLMGSIPAMIACMVVAGIGISP